MRSLRLGSLDAVVTGGTDRKGGGTGPVVVLLHGYGAPGDDLVPLWRVLDVPADVRFVFPAAPLEVPMSFGGRAWWPIDMERLQRDMMSGRPMALTREIPAGLERARTAIGELLDAVEATFAVDGQRIVLGGFSQGAMLSCDVALRSTRPLAGLVLMSATVVGVDEWTRLAPARRGLPVVQSHGRQDPLLPFGGAEMLHDLLRAAGLPVTFLPFRGGHEIPQEVLDGVGAFVTRVVGQPST